MQYDYAPGQNTITHSPAIATVEGAPVVNSLNAQQSTYVEDMGRFFEQYGSQRSLGKVIGVLLISERPLSQEDMMRFVSLSRTSTSVAVRWAKHLGFVEQVSVSGDRKRYYQIQPKMADWLARTSFQKLDDYLRLLTTAVGLADPGARESLTRMCELISFLNERIEAAFAEWHERHSGA